MNSWVRSVGVLPDESFSSWLVRAALAQGCDPLTLTGVVWPQYRAWTLDVDRGVDENRLALLSASSGVEASTFENSFLRRDAEAIAGYQLERAGTWPWILALGSRNRHRTAGAQFCPSCFLENKEPYFRRAWRFAWHTTCAHHDVCLIDRCQRCNSLVMPHKLLARDIHLGRCSNCKADFRNFKGIAPHPSSKAFQNLADAVLAFDQATYAGQILSARDWFVLARFWVDVVRYASRSKSCGFSKALQALQVPIPLNLLPLFSVQLECLPTASREVLFTNTFHLMSIPSLDIHDAFERTGVTINSLQAVSHTLPPSISKVFAGLPAVAHRRKKTIAFSNNPRSPRAVKMMWARLLRKIGIDPHE